MGPFAWGEDSIKAYQERKEKRKVRGVPGAPLLHPVTVLQRSQQKALSLKCFIRKRTYAYAPIRTPNNARAHASDCETRPAAGTRLGGLSPRQCYRSHRHSCPGAALTQSSASQGRTCDDRVLWRCPETCSFIACRRALPRVPSHAQQAIYASTHLCTSSLLPSWLTWQCGV